jgi:transposase-like protein
MGTITAELVDVGERRGARGRRVMPAERREQLIAEYRTSGLTMAAFARREGIKYSTFAGCMAKTQPSATAKPTIRFTEMRLPVEPRTTSAQNDYPVEVRLPDGTTVRGRVAAEVVALVRALRS